jgi:LmbE family N-acetylglucosaminyl deacetylase
VILVVAAHPDDEVLGCGGTIRRLVNEGKEVCVLILGEGATSRGDDPKPLREQAISANKILGVSKLYLGRLPDNRFDTVPLLDIVRMIECLDLEPDCVFTHNEGDLNIDHQITNRAVQTAFRGVREMYAFEVLSSTEKKRPLNFLPDYYVDVEETIKTKQDAMTYYTSECVSPRNQIGIAIQSLWRGIESGMLYAEGFKTLRRAM